jgi:hypothetical protein
MKKYLLLIVFIFISSIICLAQEEEISTIFGSGIKHNGGYGAFEMKLKPSSDYLYWVGGRGGWIINRTFSIGGAGYGLTSAKSFDYIQDNITTKRRYVGGYGGLFLEYINSSNNVIHFTANLLLGAGGLAYSDPHKIKNDTFYIYNYENPAAGYFIVEPGITAEINIAKFFRMGIGVSYILIPYFDVYNVVNQSTANTLDKLDKGAIDGLTVNLSFKFGRF